MAKMKYAKGSMYSNGNWALRNACEVLNVEPADIEVKVCDPTYHDRAYDVFVKGEHIGKVFGDSYSDYHIIPGTVLRQDHVETMHWTFEARLLQGRRDRTRYWADETRMQAIYRLAKKHCELVDEIEKEEVA